MRIIGGEHKGRIIDVSHDFDSRPTTEFAREALFNILANYFDFSEINFLDLFGGTGSISLECGSRGCTRIDLVESNDRAVKFIAKTAQKLNIPGIHAVRMDVFRFLDICKSQYDVIFADPPFDLPKLESIPEAVLSKDILLPGGWFILEHPKRLKFDTHPRFFDQRKYGNLYFSFFK
jgi:16S rRNA (guanine(966)-N(2))-methyltransferase RsmD